MQFDVTPYLKSPQIGASSGYLLAVRLLRAAPPQPSERVLLELERMRERALEVQQVIQERARRRGESLAPYNREHDGAYAAFRMRLQAHTLRASNPRRARASQLLATLLPEGLRFTKYKLADQWFYSETLLRRIEDEELGPELEKMVGESFLEDVRVAHAALGEALGIVGEPLPAHLPSLSEALAELGQAIADYSRVLAGEVDRRDPASVEAFLAAMAPRDAHRATRSAASSADEDQGVLDEDEAELLDDELDDAQLLELELPELPKPALGDEDQGALDEDEDEDEPGA